VTWIEQAQRNRDGRLWLELSELDIANWATVVGIDECPAQIEGEGRLVTGRFEHSSAEVLNLYVEGEPDPIGTTASHPFWSQDRQAFVSAESLTATERLRLENGRTAAVIRIEQLPGTQSVFNLEVDGEHVYHVGLNGVIVHNSCGNAPRSALTRGSNPSRLVVEGMEFRAVRNLSHVDESTLRTMARDGFAAKDINGKKLHLHHLNQNPNGPIVEIPGFRHNAHNPVQHPLGTAPGVGLTKAQREAFDGVRVRYWKERAIEELSLRGLTP
jgi:hypothetical protein